MRRHPPHPEDAAAFTALMTELRRRRLAAGIRLAALAVHIGASTPHLSSLERGTRPTAYLSMLHRISAGIGADLTYRLHGLPDPPMENRVTANLLAMYETTGDASYLGAYVMARIGAARQWLGLGFEEVAAKAGVTHTVIHHLEQPRGDVKLATAQKLCRALGGRLAVDVADIT